MLGWFITLIYCCALWSRASVVAFWCSGGDGTKSLSNSRQSLKCARLKK